MSDEKPTTVEEDMQALYKKVMDVENRYYQEVVITGVTGECPYGHREGEVFRLTNINHDCICGALYKAIHPSVLTLHYGGSIPWEKSQDAFQGICPEMQVKVEGKRVETGDLGTVFKTRTDIKNMTGKGFPAIDRYRAFIEISDIAGSCGWGHKKGERLELDPFNGGGVCGFLYAHIHQYLNMYYAGAEFPWEEEGSHIMHSMCPDTYNQVSFRLILEKR